MPVFFLICVVVSGLILLVPDFKKTAREKLFLRITFVVSTLLFLAIALPSFIPPKKKDSRARLPLEHLRMIDAAMDQYAIDFKKRPGDPVSWTDIQLYIKPGAKFYCSQVKDLFGNSYLFKEVGTLPKISPETFNALSDVAPKEFWSPYY